MSASPPAPGAATLEAGTRLRLKTIIDQLQIVRHGSPELDAALDKALGEMQCRTGQLTGSLCGRTPNATWSTSLSDALTLLPNSYNYSLGERDGVCWAWIQPNDRWQPQDHEARHDHPGGSGLVVAHSPALAVTCAVMILYSAASLERAPVANYRAAHDAAPTNRG